MPKGKKVKKFPMNRSINMNKQSNEQQPKQPETPQEKADALIQHRELYLNALKSRGVDTDNMPTEEELIAEYNKLLKEGSEIVFSKKEEAYAVCLLLMRHNPDISHFEFKECLSQFTVFYRVEPIFKSELRDEFFGETEDNISNKEVLMQLPKVEFLLMSNLYNIDADIKMYLEIAAEEDKDEADKNKSLEDVVAETDEKVKDIVENTETEIPTNINDLKED